MMMPQTRIQPVVYPNQKQRPLSLAVRVPLAPITTLTNDERIAQRMNPYVPEIGEMSTMLLAYEVANWVLE